MRNILTTFNKFHVLPNQERDWSWNILTYGTQVMGMGKIR